MKQRNDELFLQDIIEFCEHLEEYVNNVEKSDFLNNRMLQDALVRKIELIGEAAKNLSVEIQEQNPNIAWSEIARMRDKVIHHYFKVDLEIVWETATIHIGKLKSEIKPILEKLRNRNEQFSA